MANIKEYLDNILSAIFGKDVRQSIHDSIEAINEEVAESITTSQNTKNRQDLLEQKYNEQIKNMTLESPSDAEIVDARGGFDTLSKRLDAKEFKATDCSAKLGEELVTNTGWTSEGWTGNSENGFTHVVGETTPLIYFMGNTGTKKYQIEFDVETDVSTGGPDKSTAFSVILGNSQSFITYDGGGSKHYAFGIQSVSDGNLEFILTKADDPFTTSGEFEGTIKNISVREIIEPYESNINIKDNENNTTQEIRTTDSQKSNVFFGLNSGKYNTTGKQNVALGDNALENNTSGYWNTALGNEALQKNTVGSRNCAIGMLALNSNIGGDRNYALGTFALTRNTSGRRNIAIGADALWCNTTGNDNIAIGSASQSGLEDKYGNVSIGQSSMSNCIEGSESVAIGYLANGNCKGASYTTSVGARALYKNEGEYNVGIGFSALAVNTTGTQNVATGAGTLQNNLEGSGNVAIGHYAGNTCTSNNNIFIGLKAGISTTGNNNTIIGSEAGLNLTTGYNNILIGRSVNAISQTGGYQMNIGNVLYGDLSKGLICINKDKSNSAFGAVLEIGVSSNGAPPLKFTPQNLVETPVPGTFEYYNNKLYFTIGNGTRYEVQLNQIN